MLGIVTTTDLVECIVGELTPDEDDEEKVEDIEEIGEGAWRITGSASISEVEETLGVKFEDSDSDTVSGFVLGLYGSIPEDGSSFEVSTDTLDIQIEDIKDHKVESAIITLKPDEDEEAKETESES
jgi:putative hemolysin